MRLGFRTYKYVAPTELEKRRRLNLEQQTPSCDAAVVRRRWKILLLAAGGLVAVVAVCFFCAGECEPSYNGRTLSEWLDRYEGADKGTLSAKDAEQAVNAVRNIGTNALPFLMRWLLTRPPKYAIKVEELEDRMPEALQPEIVNRWMRRFDVSQMRRNAWYGFNILGTNALCAYDQLRFQLTNAPTDQTEDVAYCFSQLGPLALQPLIELAKSERGRQTPHNPAITAITMIPNLGTNAVLAVPVLIDALKTNDDSIVIYAASTLGRWTLSPEQSVPALVASVTNSAHPTLQIRALGKFGAAARSAVPILKCCLAHTNASVRVQATNALMLIAPEVITNGAAVNQGR